MSSSNDIVFKDVTGLRLLICDDDIGHYFPVHPDGDGPSPLCGDAVGSQRGDPRRHLGDTCGKCLYLRAELMDEDPDDYMARLDAFARKNTA